MNETGLEQARAALGEIVERAELAGEPTMLTRYGRPAAVVVSLDDAARAGVLADQDSRRGKSR
jgi:prevent-host-death family protein